MSSVVPDMVAEVSSAVKVSCAGVSGRAPGEGGRSPSEPGARPDTPALRFAAWAANPEHSHAARDGARWMARNRSLRASLTRLTASRSLTARADRSSSAKVAPSLRQAPAPGRDFSFA